MKNGTPKLLAKESGIRLYSRNYVQDKQKLKYMKVQYLWLKHLLLVFKHNQKSVNLHALASGGGCSKDIKPKKEVNSGNNALTHTVNEVIYVVGTF